MKANIIRLGTVNYGKALDIQIKLQKMRQEGSIENTLLLLEHTPVITLGTRGDYANIYISSEELKKQGGEIYEANRGGDVTYHGAGQIVGYFIFDLRDIGRDIRCFIQKIEQSIINLLKSGYNIDALASSGKYTGVWVSDKKIAAIGISVSKWVTLHGFAFNVNTNLEHFKWINPCGLSKGVTSLCEITGKEQDMEKAYQAVQENIAAEFNIEFTSRNIDELLKNE